MKRHRPQPATTANTSGLAPPPFDSLPSGLQEALLIITDQLAIHAADAYFERHIKHDTLGDLRTL